MTAEEKYEWLVYFGKQITGRKVASGVIETLRETYGERIDSMQLKVEILRFEPPDFGELPNSEEQNLLSAYEAAGDSLTVKQKSFLKLGVEVPERDLLAQDISQKSLQQLIERLNSDRSVNAVIVQNPVPKRLRDTVAMIAPEKDLDALSEIPGKFRRPATSEGISRVTEPFIQMKNTDNMEEPPQADAATRMVAAFAKDGAVVAVVGAEGFVGKGVVERLRELDIPCISIDVMYEENIEEQLLQVREADIVVTTVGQPGILNEKHLTPYHRLVVDCGYVPLEGGQKLGDVARSAYGIPQNITPVPNGTGPIEMAVLMERIVEQCIDPNLERWKLEDFYAITFLSRQEVAQLQRQWATEIGAIAKNYFDLVISPADRTSVVQNHLVLDTNDYKLSMSLFHGYIMIESKDGRGEIARFDSLGEMEISHCDGLNSGDRQPWQEIEKHIEQVVRERPQDRSPPSRGIGR